MLMQCPTVKRNRAAQNEATRPKKLKNRMAPDGARRCQTVPEDVRGCQMVSKGARGCQRGQIGTFVAPVSDKASELIVAKVTIAGVRGGCPRRYRGHNVLLQVGMVPEVEILPGFLEAIQHSGSWCWQCPS